MSLTKLAEEYKRRSRGYEPDDYLDIDLVESAAIGGLSGFAAAEAARTISPIAAMMTTGNEDPFSKSVQWYNRLSPSKKRLFTAATTAGAALANMAATGVPRLFKDDPKSKKGEIAAREKLQNEYLIRDDDNHTLAEAKRFGIPFAVRGGIQSAIMPIGMMAMMGTNPTPRMLFSKPMAKRIAKGTAVGAAKGLAIGTPIGLYQDYLDKKHDRYDRGELL